MTDQYEHFMVYELQDTGERNRVNVDESNLQSVLHPEQVLVIVKEEIRRIFIWKGSKSPVRKRFISSRIASTLQEELVTKAAFHRCKIISVDAGDEPHEFLNAFRLESMEVTERLPDMHYIRNIDREKMIDSATFPEQPEVVKVENKKEEEYFSPALQELKEKGVSEPSVSANRPSSKAKPPIPKQSEPKRTYIPYPAKPSDATTSQQKSVLTEYDKKKIMDKIIKNEISDKFKRQNLILGHTLYGAVSKKVSVFGKEVEETEWEPVKALPKGMIELDNHMLRVYFDDIKGIVEAIEILEQLSSSDFKTKKKLKSNKIVEKESEEQEDYSSWTVKDLKVYCEQHDIEVPSGARKVEIIELIENTQKNDVAENKINTSKRRRLPKIPNSKD